MCYTEKAVRTLLNRGGPKVKISVCFSFIMLGKLRISLIVHYYLTSFFNYDLIIRGSKPQLTPFLPSSLPPSFSPPFFISVSVTFFLYILA